MSDKTGGCAFPNALVYSRDASGRQLPFDAGMTLRDYFAAQALVGVLLAQETSGSVAKLADVMQGVRAGGHEARTAYALADAMLAERAK